MRTRIALVLALLGGLTLLPAASAQAAPEAWKAYDGNLVAVTQGYGHGIGMSQYGAKGRADAGQTVDQILSFYYPGTTKGTSTGLIKVWITADDDQNVVVRPTAGLRVVDLGNGKSYTLPTAGKATAWRLTVVAGTTRVNWLKDGTWRGYRPNGKLLTGVGEFRSTANLLNLYHDGANHPYRGAMRLAAGHTINVLSLDNYLKGVVASEMPALWATQALRAQAVAARTYAAFERTANPNRSFHVYDTTRSQVYKGYTAEHPNTNAAITATAGRVVLYGGQLAFTQFSASNGGFTAKGGKPYLVGKADTFDTAYRNRELMIGPVTAAKIQKAYPALGTLTRVRVLERDTDHRVLKVELDGSKTGTVIIKGTALRSLIGLRSTYFSFTS
ncbi:MAG: SpoIID/LytB domain-containing protein [Microbacterium sp.]|nr:MAG: SpoIID/LytB domain-containing protein [Microbacterium sp.]